MRHVIIGAILLILFIVGIAYFIENKEQTAKQQRLTEIEQFEKDHPEVARNITEKFIFISGHDTFNRERQAIYSKYSSRYMLTSLESDGYCVEVNMKQWMKAKVEKPFVARWLLIDEVEDEIEIKDKR